MKAVYITEFGGPKVLDIREVAEPPPPASSQILVQVRAAGLNRADLLQRRGLYPPPAGYSPNIPGLEFAGEIVDVGKDVARYKAGNRVFGITAGEAQAQFLLVDESLAAEIPENLSFTEAAAVPEVFITAHDAVFVQGKLEKNEWLLVHAVGSGVGLAALQLAKALGSRVIGTSRTQDKLDRCREFGLDVPLLAEGLKFAKEVMNATGEGADVILDLVGAAYFSENLASAAQKGRLLLVGLTGGALAEFDLRTALSKRLTIIGTSLRSRRLEEKADAVRRFSDEVVPLFAKGIIRPNVGRTFPLGEIRAAHDYLESNESFGKVVVEF
jgi:putative PIG3 family NAD(P)H quinone oxidoreductase